MGVPEDEKGKEKACKEIMALNVTNY